MIFNKFRTAMPISNNKIAGFGDRNATNPSLLTDAVSPFSAPAKNAAPVKKDVSAKESKEKAAKSQKDSSAERYKAFVTRHNRLSQEIDRKNKT
ncbi:MAG: hypothetical protein PHE93_02615 [Clostridia bacterium]|nr:hypothetical protein [Clostridia bacterium]